MMNPTVSVTIPCYNSQGFIKETIQSVLDQTFSDFEIVVIDDGSQDGTGEIVNNFNDHRIRYFHQKNRGLSYTRDRLVALSEGEYIAFLDHDDVWLPEKLEKQMAVFSCNQDLGLVYSDCFIIDGMGDVVSRQSKRIKLHRGQVFKELLYRNFIPIPTVLMKKKVLSEFLPFPPYKIAEEYAVFLKCAEKYPLEYVDEPLAKYRSHDSTYAADFELSLKESLGIYDYWSQKLSGKDKNIEEIIKKGKAEDFFVAGKKELYQNNNSTKARKYFLEALKNHIILKAVLFWGLSFVSNSVILKTRQVVKKRLDYL